jgi:hypothetical protein
LTQLVMYPGLANSPQTELSAAINNTVVTISLVDASKVPAAPNLVTIGTDETAETILYTGISGNNLTGVTRGVEGTAKSWSIGAKVSRNFTNRDYATLKGNVEDLDTRAVAHEAETVTRVFNIVTGFAADPLGVADSKAAIQSAIDACSAAGGGDVYCPRGTYLISDRLTMRSNVRLIGAGSMSIIKAASTLPANKQLIINATITGSVDTYYDTNMTVSDLVFDGNNNLLRTAELVEFNKASYIRVESVTFRNNSHMGIGFGGCFVVDIKDSWFINLGRPKPSAVSAPAIYADNSGDGSKNKLFTVHDCKFISNNWSGMYFMVQGGTISKCKFMNNGESTIFISSNGTNIKIDGCYIYGAVRSNISASGIECGAPGTIITGSHILNCGNSGISLTNVQDVLVDDCIIMNNGQENTYFTGAAGVEVATTATNPNQPRNIKISNNRIGDNQGTKTQKYGFNAGGSGDAMQYVEVVDNNLVGNATTAINVSATKWGVGCRTTDNAGHASAAPVVSRVQTPVATGNLSITGIGFKPRLVTFDVIAPSGTLVQLGTGSMTESAQHSTYATTDGTLAVGSVTANKPLLVRDAANAIAMDASFVSMDADGFTLNFTTVTSRPWITFTAYP